MANGKNEPLTFTREDSERLVRIEGGLQDLTVEMREYIKTHNELHARTRRQRTKVLLWLISGSGGVGLGSLIVQMLLK
jgi:hypothetical protein